MNTNNLPPLPSIDQNDHPEPHTMKWSVLEIKWIQSYASEYGQLCRQPLLDTIEQQRKLLEQAEKDAARFRWLYDHAWDANYYFNKDGSLKTICVTCKDTATSSGLDMDRLIDEAITNHLRQQEGEKR